MNTGRILLAVSIALLAASGAATLRAADELGTEEHPKHFHWQGEVKGETVTMDIDATPFVAARHKIRDHGGVVDGYHAQPGYLLSWGSGFPYYTIKDWTVRWARRRLRLFPRGVYTSIFTPQLRAADAHPDVGGVEVIVCDGGDALMVTMGFGYDGVTGTVAFVITRDGRIRRFIMGVFS